MSSEVAPPLAAGRLRLRRILGEGGVGTVYLAYDERLDVVRAVKVLAAERSSNQVQRQRFLTEARIQARLRHPNIVEVYDIEDEGGQVYLVMELVEGGSLWDRLKETGPLEPTEGVAVAIGILAGLEQAHAENIVHRDIKPHNILVSNQGVPKLADFGVAHLPSEELEGVTRSGVVMGTWSFMAPEQRASSRRVDRRSDIYAVAATLYTLITGHTEPDLFDHELDTEVMERLPEVLRPVLHRATRYARSQRYPDAHSFREDLERCLPALMGVPAAATPRAGTPADAPDAAHHIALAARGPVATTQDHSVVAASEDRSGTLVPSAAEVERLLATPSGAAARAGATFSDDGHTMELQAPLPASQGPESTADGAVELPIDDPEEVSPPSGDAVAWTIDDERELEGEGAEPEEADDLPEWRPAGSRRFQAFLLGLVLATLGVVVYQQQLLELLFPAAVERPDVGEPTPPPPEPEPVEPDPQPVKPKPEPVKPKPDPEPVPEPGPEPDPVEPKPDPDATPVPDPEPERPPPVPSNYLGLDPELDGPAVVHDRVKKHNEGDIWDCYHQALLVNPRLEGTLSLRWEVQEGAVTSPMLVAPQSHVDIGRCAVEAVSGWQYPPWFSGMPSIQSWELDVVDQTQRFVDKLDVMHSPCRAGFTDEEIAAFGTGKINIDVEGGWVRSVVIAEGFENQPLQDCLRTDALGWRFPPYGRGVFWLIFTLAPPSEG